jgi:transposase
MENLSLDTQKQLQFIIDNYSLMTCSEISLKLQVPSRWIRRQANKLIKEGKISRKGITDDRKSPEKIQFIFDNYGKLSKPEIATKLKESPRWVKRQINELIKSKKLIPTRPKPEKILSDSDWTEEIKNRVFELRNKFLKTNDQIAKVLKSEFDIEISSGSLQFWLNRFKYYGRTKQDWLNEFLPRSLAEKLLQQGYKMTDISKYLKKEYGVYVSDDLILGHLQKIGLESLKMWKIHSINNKSKEFSKEWLSERINGHLGLNGLSREMGFSKTIVMKRIKEEDLKLISHRKVWSKNLDILREQLLKLSPVEGLFPEDFHQMMLGWLLGDGHMRDRNGFSINHSIVQLDYLYVKTRVLKKYISSIITVPANHFSGDYILGGMEQLGIACPGYHPEINNYERYLNPDRTKNYEKIISELNPLGWACYFMDDGSGNRPLTISMKNEFIDYFINKYNFGNRSSSHNIIVKEINPDYIIPGMAYKVKSESVGSFWKKIMPELFNPEINQELDLCLIKPYVLKNDMMILNKAVEYYHKRGFPYFSISDDYLKKEFHRLSIFNTPFLWKEPNILLNVNVGNNIFKHFMPHMAEAKYRSVSPKETFDNYMMLRKVLEYSLTTKKSIIPDIIHDNLIHFNGGIIGFSCGVAKALVERYSKENDTVVDPCSGWGGRLLGTITSKRKYVGFEPWDKTYRGLQNIISFFNIEADIINSEFLIDKAPESCDMIFTSPPYIDLETYGYSMTIEKWKELMINIFKYAERALKKDCYLILNVPEFLKGLLPYTILEEKEKIYWFTVSKKRKTYNSEMFFIWRKI